MLELWSEPSLTSEPLLLIVEMMKGKGGGESNSNSGGDGVAGVRAEAILVREVR